MIKDSPDTNLNNVDYETQEETDLQKTDAQPFQITSEFINSLGLFTFVVVLMFITPYIVPFLFTGSIDIYDYVKFDPSLFNSLKINLTSQERNEISRKMTILCDILYMPQTSLQYFKPLFKSKINTELPSNLIPLNKISFIISTSLSNLNLTKLYLDIWSTKYGSKIIAETEIQPYKTVYLKTNHNFNSSLLNLGNYKVVFLNETNSIDKWPYMLNGLLLLMIKRCRFSIELT